MNVKPGDLAICTHGRHAGTIGTVLRPWVPGQIIDGKLWADAPPELAPFWVVEASGVFVNPNGKSDKRGPFPDSWLRPVPGSARDGERRAGGDALTRHLAPNAAVCDLSVLLSIVGEYRLLVVGMPHGLAVGQDVTVDGREVFTICGIVAAGDRTSLQLRPRYDLVQPEKEARKLPKFDSDRPYLKRKRGRS